MADGDILPRADEIECPVVGSPQIVLLEDAVGDIGEVALGEEHQLDGFVGRRIQ